MHLPLVCHEAKTVDWYHTPEDANGGLVIDFFHPADQAGEFLENPKSDR